jgi:hypothetical protein
MQPEGRTAGDFPTEGHASVYLDKLLDTASEMFKICREVDGVHRAPSARQKTLGVRIDYVLWPKRRLIDLGWRFGVIGIERKKSNHPAGGLIAQAEDYMQSIFKMPHGVDVCLNSVFLFPAFENTGVVASILAQRRIGFVFERRGRLGLSLNHTALLDWAYETGDPYIGKSVNLNCGGKVGSR